MKILISFLAISISLVGCDVTEAPAARNMSVTGSNDTDNTIPAFPIVSRSWSVCAAGKAPAPTCAACGQSSFSWSYKFRTSDHDTIEFGADGDTCISLGSLSDTLQIRTLSIGRSGRLDSIWLQTDNDSSHYEVLWDAHRMAPDLYRRTIDSIAGAV